MPCLLFKVLRLPIVLAAFFLALPGGKSIASEFAPKWVDHAQLDFGTFATCRNPSCRTTFPVRGNRFYGSLEGSYGRFTFGVATHGFKAIAMGYDGYSYVNQYSLGVTVTPNISLYTVQGEVDSKYLYARDYSVLGVEFTLGEVRFAGEHQRMKTHYFEPRIKRYAALWQPGSATSLYASYFERGMIKINSVGAHYEGERLTLDAVSYFYHSDFGDGQMWLGARYHFTPEFASRPFSVFGNFGFNPNFIDEFGVYTLGLSAPVARNTSLEFSYSAWYRDRLSNTSIANIGVRLRYKFGRKRHRVLDQITDFVRENREPYILYYDTSPLSRGLFGYTGRTTVVR